MPLEGGRKKTDSAVVQRGVRRIQGARDPLRRTRAPVHRFSFLSGAESREKVTYVCTWSGAKERTPSPPTVKFSKLSFKKSTWPLFVALKNDGLCESKI